MFCTPAKVVTARKEHRCTWCCEPILIGDTYERWLSIDGSPMQNKMHLECVASIEASETGPWEYCPGDGQGLRPAPGEFGRPMSQQNGSGDDY